MKVGVNILNFGPGVGPEALVHWAQVSEALGYHSVWISDHVAITPTVGARYPEPYYDPFISLAWLAAQTKRVQLGTTVIVLPYRNAVLTARMAANIDRMSGGRLIFGVGVGGFEDEFVALGVPLKQRGRLGDETLAAIEALWNAEAPVSYEGRLVQFESVQGIGTAQRPRPPVWVGGWAEGAIRRAVRFGDGWHPILRPGFSTEQGLGDLKRIAEEEARPVPAFCPRIRIDIRKDAVDGERQAGVGSVEQVRADIGALALAGAEHLVLDWYTGDLEATRHYGHGFEMLARLAEDVLDLPNEAMR